MSIRRLIPLVLLVVALPVTAGARRSTVDGTSVATLEGSNEIFLEVEATARDSYVSMAMRYGRSERDWAAIERANGHRPVREGFFYAIPFDVLRQEHRNRTLAALFPRDAAGSSGWIHEVPDTDAGQRLERIALWFTGDAGLADDLAESNGIAWAPLGAGSRLVVPSSLLAPGLKEAFPAVAVVRPEPVSAPPPPPPTRSVGPVKVGALSYKDDYALYTLQKGESLYSAVVLRYTNRLDPKEVTSLARDIAARSGIRNFDSIPVGKVVKIPRSEIRPEFLPSDDPRRIVYSAGIETAEQHAITVQARDLDGVAIILDSGHGGDDIGAQRNGVHEDDYVYDILCRIKQLAEETTGAKVLATIKDKSAGYKPHKGPFTIDKDEYLLTSPRYYPRKPHAGTAGVNLRWYLVNSYYRSLVADGYDPQRIVFISIHADSRHPSVRGAMVYVPGQEYRQKTYGHVGSQYKRKEVEELRYVKFSRKERQRSEGLSRKLANEIIDTFQKADMPVHKDKPVRDHVIRGRRTYAPAVIRTSLVPQSILLEVLNLSNKKDARLIKDPDYRQKIAVAFLDALKSYYDQPRPTPGGTSTASSR